MTASPETTGSAESLSLDEDEIVDIDTLRAEIDDLDKIILDAVQRRAELTQELGNQRVVEGGTRIEHSDELRQLGKYAVLGPEGMNMGMLMLRISRGRLGDEATGKKYDII